MLFRSMKSRDFEHVALVAALQRETGGNTAEVIDTVTDMATGIPGLIQHVTHEEVLAVANKAGARLGNVIKGVVARL